MASAVQKISSNFVEMVNIKTQRWNLELRGKLTPILASTDFGNDSVIASQAVTLLSSEIFSRADALTSALTGEVDEHIANLTPEDVLTLTQIHQQWMVNSIGQALNELYGRYEPNAHRGKFDDGIVRAILTEGITQAQGAAFGDASHRLKTYFRKSGLDPDSIGAKSAQNNIPTPNQTVFIDTNCFIHLTDLKDLPWRKHFSKIKWVEIVVATVVVEELDKHKVSRDPKVNRRSRLALNMIDKASEAAEGVLTLRAENPKVTLRLYPLANTDAQKATGLDLSIPDNRLVAAFVEARWPAPSKLMSCDTGPRITARRLGYSDDVITPPDDWFLPDPTDTDEVKGLKSEVARLKATLPQIEIECEDELEWIVPDFPPLPSDVVSRSVAKVLSQNPRLPLSASTIDALTSLMSNNRGLTQYDIDGYEREYSKYTETVRTFFGSLHQAAKHYAYTQAVSLLLRNLTCITAENVLLEISVNDGSFLCGNEDDANKITGDLVLPTPPRRPKSHAEREIERFGQLSPRLYNLPEKPKDPTSFYWQDYPSYGDQIARLICKEFRASETFEMDIFAALPPPGTGTYSMDFKITATNLPAPKHAQVKVHVKTGSVSWADENLPHYLPQHLIDLLALTEPSSGAPGLDLASALGLDISEISDLYPNG